ncbi:MAG: hypothetical protein IID16_13545, partial [Candidatus Marinimicrobia bacterium]|nr:hypothetical protein [Candidatus Neomarinimicrobiota bacterium]
MALVVPPRVLEVPEQSNLQHMRLQYSRDELVETDPMDIISDIQALYKGPWKKNREIIQKIFDTFLINWKWPYSRELSVEILDIGDL